MDQVHWTSYSKTSPTKEESRQISKDDLVLKKKVIFRRKFVHFLSETSGESLETKAL